MKLSVIIIAKNAQNVIKEAILSANFADEIIVVNNNSTDETEKLAKALGARVLTSKTDSFAQLRNFGLEKANGEWVLYIDSDERIDGQLKKNIISLISDSNTGKADYFRVKRKNYYLGNHEWPYIEKLERFFKKTSLKGWHGKLHESPIVQGKAGEMEGFLLHYTHTDLTSMLKKTIEWSDVEAELRLKTDHPKMTWWRFPRVMISAFFVSYVKQEGWKVGTVGLIESIYQGFSAFITYAKLWELQNEKIDKN